MNDEIALKVENVSKQYRLGQVGTGTLSHDLNRWWHKIRGKEDPYSMIGDVNDRSTIGNSEYVWALKDINFELKKGEILGVIGKNGAGKSTLLKILSRVTGPSSGKITMKGRVASLLEVGTGMHPELSGRENIYLNGAILGMTHAEVKSKIEEIIDFSGCIKYIDTPVKRYSSGMRVRLGFAVAAFLEPEILIVDEVLAVGDFEFQKKAIGKMKDISSEGNRTVLFVSHNMSSIKNLCKSCIVLNNGQIDYTGDTESAIDFYTKRELKAISKSLHQKWEFNDAPGNSKLKILELEIKPLNGGTLSIDSGVSINYSFCNSIVGSNIGTTIEILNAQDIMILHTGEFVSSNKDSKEGIYHVSFQIAANTLNMGEYKISLIFGENQRYMIYKAEDIASFEIKERQEYKSITISKNLPGILSLDLKPEISFSEQ